MPSPRLYVHERRTISALVGTMSATSLALVMCMMRWAGRSPFLQQAGRVNVMGLLTVIACLGSTVGMQNSHNLGYQVGSHCISFDRIAGWGNLENRRLFRFCAMDAHTIFRMFDFSSHIDLITCSRWRFTAEEAFLVVLRRLSYPGCWC